jgi:hypothetical protein
MTCSDELTSSPTRPYRCHPAGDVPIRLSADDVSDMDVGEIKECGQPRRKIRHQSQGLLGSFKTNQSINGRDLGIVSDRFHFKCALRVFLSIDSTVVPSVIKRLNDEPLSFACCFVGLIERGDGGSPPLLDGCRARF